MFRHTKTCSLSYKFNLLPSSSLTDKAAVCSALATHRHSCDRTQHSRGSVSFRDFRRRNVHHCNRLSGY